MKKLFVILTVVIFAVLTFSCQQDEIIPVVDTETIQNQLFLLGLPEITEAVVLSSNGTKSANVGDVIYKAMPKYTYKVYENKAIKYITYMEVDNSGYFSSVKTLIQIFRIVNGKLDDKNYELEVQIGCPAGKIIRIKDEPNIDYIWYSAYLYMEDGREFGYFDPQNQFNENHTLELIPVEGAVWKIVVGTNSHYMLGKDKYELFETNPITEKLFESNKDNSEIEVKIVIDLEKESNFFLEIDKDDNLWSDNGGYVESIFLYSENGQAIRLNVSSKGYENSKRIFSSKFSLNQVGIAYRLDSFDGSGGWVKNYSVIVDRVQNGKTYYRLVK